VGEKAQLDALLKAVRAGDPGAAKLLYEQFGPSIRAAVRRQLHPRLRNRFDSLDFVQDVWASFLSAPPEQNTFESYDSLVGFLRQIARNKVTDMARRRFATAKDDAAREVAIDSTDDTCCRDVPGRTPTPSQFVIADEQLEILLSQFPAGYHAIVLRLRDGYSLDEIAQMTKVSRSTVDRVVRRLKEISGVS
jgi:RNA polymerase sigma factor (sigma-70 family)